LTADGRVRLARCASHLPDVAAVVDETFNLSVSV
jgi:hypothetical protein